MSKKPPSTDILSAFSHSVQQRREFLGITQEELAHRCGLHRTYISDIERGGRNLSLKNLIRLATGLEISVSTLVHWTEIKQAGDHDLTEGELRDFFNNAPCGYYCLNQAGMILRTNDRALEWLGYDRTELTGREISSILTPCSREVFQNWFDQHKESRPSVNVTLELLRKDGSAMSVLMASSAITDGAGRFVASRCVIFDISDKKSGLLSPVTAAAQGRAL